MFHSDGYGCKRRQAQMLDEQIAEKHRREALKACQLFNAVGVSTGTLPVGVTGGILQGFLQGFLRQIARYHDIEVWVMDLGC